METSCFNWWLVRATYVGDGRFFGHSFWKVVGSYAHTHESRTATVHGELTCGGGGNIRIHVYLQLLYTVNSRVVVGAIYAYMCTYSYRTRCTHVWWWGQYMHTCVPTATVHSVPYTVHHTRCTHVWWWGQYTHTCVPTATVHGELTCGGGGNIHIHVYLQLLYTVYRTRRTVHGALYTVTSRVEGAFTCAGDIHVWELLT